MCRRTLYLMVGLMLGHAAPAAWAGDACGTFADDVLYGTGSGPWSVAIDDLDLELAGTGRPPRVSGDNADALNQITPEARVPSGELSMSQSSPAEGFQRAGGTRHAQGGVPGCLACEPTVFDGQIGITLFPVQECLDGFWEGLAYAFDAGVFNQIKFLLSTNRAGGDLYVMGNLDGTCQPDVNDILYEGCCVLSGLETGVEHTITLPLAISATEKYWLVFVGRSGQAGQDDEGNFDGSNFPGHQNARDLSTASLPEHVWANVCTADGAAAGSCADGDGDGDGSDPGTAWQPVTDLAASLGNCYFASTALNLEAPPSPAPDCANEPNGACCFDKGASCTQLRGFECGQQGGTYLGDGSECGVDDCPVCGDGQECFNVQVQCIATGDDSSVDGYLAFALDEYGSFASAGFGGGNAECAFGDMFNPAGAPGAREAAFSNGFFLYRSGQQQRGMLACNATWNNIFLGFNLGTEIPVDGANLPSDANGDGTDDTLTSRFNVCGVGVDLTFDVVQQVAQVSGLGVIAVATLTQTYTITNNGDQAIEFVLLRQADYDLLWDPAQDFADDSVGTATNALPDCDRYVYQMEDGQPETAVTISSPQGDIYYGGKRDVDPDGAGPGPAYGFGTDTQQWDAYGVPEGWSNHIAGVGYDTDGESGPAPAGCTSPCDGFVGLSIPVSLEGGAQTEVTILHTYGANLPANCPTEDCGDCPTDGSGDGDTGANDLPLLLACWGPLQPGCECFDFNGSGAVGAEDLPVLLAAWGPCP